MKYLVGMFFIFMVSCKQEKKYHNLAKTTSVVVKDTLVQDILNWQAALNEEYANPETSPLADRYRKNFEGLDFFAPDTSFIVKAYLERTPEAIPFLMPTTTDRKSKEVVYGIASFVLKGKKCAVEIYQNKNLMLQEEYKDYLFFPFLDVTNGRETYGGGRYIDLSIPEGDTLLLNFNKAYNPYCAYNKKYSCPIVPGINYLDLEIKAGVKSFNTSKK